MATALYLLNSYGDVDTAHRLLSGAIALQPEPYDPADAAVLEAARYEAGQAPVGTVLSQRGRDGEQGVDRDIVFTMVTASAALEAVTTGPGGVLTSPHTTPGVLIDTSTVSPQVSALIRNKAADHGTDFLAATVSGNPKVINAGKLTVAVSGSPEVFSWVEPLLAVLGRGVTYVGEGEAARLVKIAHNVFLGVVTQSLAEITVLAEKGGVSRAAFLEFLNDSVMGSAFTRYKSPALVNLDFTPTFTMPLLRKDLDLGLAAGRELQVPMPLAAATAQLVAGAIGAGHVEEDFASLILGQARSSGVALEPQSVPVDDDLSFQN